MSLAPDAVKLKIDLRRLHPERPLFDPRRFVCDICGKEHPAHSYDEFDTKDDGAHVCSPCMFGNGGCMYDGVAYRDNKSIWRANAILKAIQREAVYAR